MALADRARLNRRWHCRLTTRGRKSGRSRTVTVWFVLDGNTLYLTGGKDVPQWCRNIRADGAVAVAIAGRTLRGRGRVVEDPAEGQAVIERFLGKYLLARLSRPFGGYTRSVPVVVALDEDTGAGGDDGRES